MIPIKTQKEIEVMEMGGHILKETIDELSLMVKPGVKTIEIEKRANEIIKRVNGKPGFKGYGGFPFSICASINEEIVHGFPSERVLKNGDIFSLDFGIFFKLETLLGKDFDKKDYPNIIDGFNTDMARTYAVGEIEDETKRLLIVTRKMLKLGIKKIRPGITVGDIGETMQRYAERQGFEIVRDLCGHGIGKDLHEDPSIPNYGQRHKGAEFKEGMVVCIEPMLTMGGYDIKLAKDGSTYVTKDGSLSAHFEDMVAVTKYGAILLTK